jgi:putative transposase
MMYGSPVNAKPVPKWDRREPYIMSKVLPSQRLLKQFEERLVIGEMSLSEIFRSGAQLMLQHALEVEVSAAVGRGYYENAPETTKSKGRRNGYESRRVLSGEGPVTVQVPQVRGTETGYRSKILDAYVSRTEKLDELIARMYVHGMSTRDIEATFSDVLSGTGVSKSVVSRVTECLSEDFEAFRKRDLSGEKLLYLELDGTYLRYHQGTEKKEPILVATGYRIDGTRVLLHIGPGNRESYENWKGLLHEMVARGLNVPLLIVTDGNPGVLKAIEELFPKSLKQRCQRHRLENILGKAPKEVGEELKAAVLESFHADNYEDGLEKGREVIKRYSHRFPSAMKCMEETLEDCLQVLKLPQAHHKRLRTANLLERTFGENKRRTKVIPHFFTEKAALKLTYAVLLAVANKWRGVRMDVFTARQVEELRKKTFIDSAEKQSAA